MEFLKYSDTKQNIKLELPCKNYRFGSEIDSSTLALFTIKVVTKTMLKQLKNGGFEAYGVPICVCSRAELYVRRIFK